jgi:hypothetical protein
VESIKILSKLPRPITITFRRPFTEKLNLKQIPFQIFNADKKDGSILPSHADIHEGTTTNDRFEAMAAETAPGH